MKLKIQQTVVILCSIMFHSTGLTQNLSQDDFNANTSYTLQGDSDVDISFVNLNARLYQKQIKENKGKIELGLVYYYTNLDYENNLSFGSNLEDFHTIGLTFSYFKIINKKWNYFAIITPQVSSNFTSSIKSQDLNPSIVFLFNYSKTVKSRLGFGLAYIPNIGITFPIPLINYWKKFNEKSEMNLGFPETYYSYNAFSKTVLKTGLKFEALNYNISENFQINNENAERVNYNAIIAGVGFKHTFSNLFNVFLDVGYSLNRTLEYTDQSGDQSFEFEVENNLNISFGLGINFDKKNKSN